MSVLDTLRQVRTKYPTIPSNEDCGKIINETAWIHRAEGWGLSGKPGGANTPQPVSGIPIARDILHHQPSNQIYDVLIAAGDGGPATPAWQGPMTAPDPNARPWVAPTNDGYDGNPDPGPGPDPDPEPDTDAWKEALDQALERWAVLLLSGLQTVVKQEQANFGCPVEFKIFGQTVKGWVGKKPEGK
jgi:hypothetical protein